MSFRTLKIKNQSKPVYVTKKDTGDLMEMLRKGHGVQMTKKDGKVEVRFFDYDMEDENESPQRES